MKASGFDELLASERKDLWVEGSLLFVEGEALDIFNRGDGLVNLLLGYLLR